MATAALLRQGALGAIFVAATVPDRAMQLPASRVLLYLSPASVAAASLLVPPEVPVVAMPSSSASACRPCLPSWFTLLISLPHSFDV